MNEITRYSIIEGENEEEYVKRISSTVLPNWPKEVIKEWLYRHQGFLKSYSLLDWESFNFTKVSWTTDKIPGREAFLDMEECDRLNESLLGYAELGDWLASFMVDNGTWNTPVILLSNLNADLKANNGKLLNSPLHLLEGHRRLGFFTKLRQTDKAKDKHFVWLVTIGAQQPLGL